MLDNIKSSFFKHILFHHLNIKRKLRIIKYNKSLQHLLNVKFIEYKIFSEKYIIFGKNGKGKEYDRLRDKLMYEGEFKNGKRNGKGKEFFITGKIEGNLINYSSEDDLLIFEGEYINGERNGKGNEYYADGKIKFEGEYKNGERNGKGKKYYYTNTQLEFEGEYKNGEKWDGKGYDINGNILFELKQGNGFIKNKGDYKNGKLNGYVNEYYFKGEYLNGKRNGKGKEYNWRGDLIFEGEYKNGLKWNGQGHDNPKYEIKKGKWICWRI